jgi:hypothetical protein
VQHLNDDVAELELVAVAHALERERCLGLA